MKHNEFCYWLQGYFEIGALEHNVTHLGKDGLECVERHLALVEKVEGKKLTGFAAWLGGFLAHAGCCDAKDVEKIRARLAEEFQHVIDPSYGGDQDGLNAIHHGPRPPTLGDSVVFRC